MEFYYSLKKYVLGTFYVDVMNLGTATEQFHEPKMHSVSPTHLLANNTMCK